MDIRQLRTFVQVAEMRSITRAAAALHTAQPALSRQLRLLEEELGRNALRAQRARGHAHRAGRATAASGHQSCP
jgi:DNA-binding transcriptional LysR family regulator